MEKHFVIFYSPGTFVSEQSERPIDSWAPAAAVRMADEIRERHGATPYGFVFTTRSRGPNDLDSKESARSGVYYLGGKIETRAEVEARNAPDEQIMRDNMRINKIERVIINTNSWKVTMPFKECDVLLDYTPPALSPA